MTERQGRRRRFRPTLSASVVVAAGVSVLVVLGIWQLQRLAWKEELIALRAARLSEPAGPLPRDLGDPADLEYLRVAATGRFLHERALFLANRIHERKVGLHMVTPFVLEDGRGLLVDRGWIPMEMKEGANLSEAGPTGRVTVTGVLRRGGWGGLEMFRPENDPARRLYNWPDLAAMAAQADLERSVVGLYLAAEPNDGAGDAYPVAVPIAVELRNDHLQYALTWFALALVLVIIYVVYHLRPEREQD